LTVDGVKVEATGLGGRLPVVTLAADETSHGEH
jgi:hypothetical protein